MRYNLNSRYRNLELLTTPSSIFSSLIADLQHARETIDMEYYIFANDRTGHLFADLLRRKARQGVRVRLIVDGYGSISIGRNMQRALLNGGVDLTCHTLLSRSRNHRKMAIIDGSVAHVGGVNIADRYVVGNTLGLWYDAQLRITGGGVAALLRLFDYDYMVSEGVMCEMPKPYSEAGFEVVWSECRGGRAMSELLSSVIASARKRLLFTTPYFIPPKGIINELAAAVERGVEVTIIVPEKCDIWVLDHIIRNHIAHALSRGINIRICRRAFVHAKIAVVDGCRVVIGSANLDARSINLNREVMVVSQEYNVVEMANRFVDKLLWLSYAPEDGDSRSYIPSFVCRWLEGVL